MTDCGGCFTEMKELIETHPVSDATEVVGHVCPGCYRVYYETEKGTRRLDTRDSLIECDANA